MVVQFVLSHPLTSLSVESTIVVHVCVSERTAGDSIAANADGADGSNLLVTARNRSAHNAHAHRMGQISIYLREDLE